MAAGYDVAVCAACGFVYADTDATQADYDRFYAEHSKYEDAKTGTGGVDNPLDWKRQQETARQIADVLGDAKLSVLDVGCANGGLLKALKDLGYENLCGIDPSPACVENTRRIGVEARRGSLFQPFKKNAYARTCAGRSGRAGLDYRAIATGRHGLFGNPRRRALC